MAFSLTSKQVELRGSWLVAMVRKSDDASSWTFARINLNDHIGNNDGVFDVTMDRWYNTAEDWSVYLRGPFLYARLRTISGGYGPETCINLDLFIRNRDGNLEFQKLGDSLLLYTAGLTLSNSILRGLVVGRDGKFRTSEINLDEFYGNIGGKFEVDERHYSRTGRNFVLERKPDALTLSGELEDYEGVHHPAEIDLSACVINRKGRLSFSKPNDSEKERWISAIAEQVPILGAAVAGLYHLADESRTEAQCYYDIASTTNSAAFTFGVAIGAFIGRACGSPALGTVIGAQLSASPDVFVEDKIANKIEDSETRNQIQEAILGTRVFETLREMIVDGQATAAAEWLSESLNPEIDEWKKSLTAWLEKQNLTVLADISLYSTMKRVFTRLQGEPVEEWAKALELYSAITRVKKLALKPEDPPKIVVVEPETPAEPEAIEAPEAATTDAEATPEAGAAATNELEAAGETQEAVPAEATTSDAATATEPQAQPETAASSVTRASSTKSVLKDATATTPAAPAKAGSDKADKPPTRSGLKQWHSVIGIPVWRKSWSRPRQQRVV